MTQAMTPIDRERVRFDRRMRRLARDRTSSSTTICLRAIDELLSYLSVGTAPLTMSDVTRVRRRLDLVRSGQPSLTIVQAIVAAIDALLDPATRSAGAPRIRPSLVRNLRSLRRGIVDARSAVAREGLRLFRKRRSVVTLSFSSEVLEVLRSADRFGRLGTVWVGETGGRCEGRALVGELRRLGVDARSFALGASRPAIRAADLGLIGADTIEADGAVVSKVGSHPLARQCRDLGRPFYVTSALSKMAADPSRPGPKRGRGASGLPVRRPALRSGLFDRTPARLVSGYVTDRGLRHLARRGGRSPRSPGRGRR